MQFALTAIVWCICLLAPGIARGDTTPQPVADSAAQPAAFYRGINLNGPATVIDGHAWDGNDADHFDCNGTSFANQQVELSPTTDAPRSEMIRSSRWGRSLHAALTDVPAGDYQVFLYVWEDNETAQYRLSVNGQTVISEFHSGAAGNWRRLGPWLAQPQGGRLEVAAEGGDANFSGLEMWAGRGPLPSPETGFNDEPTPEQLAFFESRIRPLLIAHCYECHSQQAKEIGGGLVVDSRPGLQKGGDTEPPLVPGHAAESLLIRAVKQSDPDLKMPPDGRLSDAEIADLQEWITMGAPDPRTDDTASVAKTRSAIDWDAARDFWSLRPLQRPPLPVVHDAGWPLEELDRFILGRLEAEGLSPAVDATKAVWLRRVTYDLTGLPPTPDELAVFEADHSADAHAVVLDRLLATPQYGERWGRHWLDVVRYSDTAGDNSDYPIPQMYLYRNWVIDAFNRDLPYDQFVREQLCGDLLPSETNAQAHQRLIATGYIASARRFGSRVDDYPQHLTIEDTLDNLGRTFLATTVNCARCHQHKFDPIPTEDYYALYGIFNSTRYPWPGIEMEQRQRDLVPLVSQETVERVTAERLARRQSLEAAVRTAEHDRDAASEADRGEKAKLVDAARTALQAADQEPAPYPLAYAVAEASQRGDVAVQQKGNPAKPGAVVPRHFLTMLGGATLPAGDTGSGRRQLAEWIVNPDNPLTARVIVNRVWLYHFGRGLVPTPNDFGRQGKPPTHPELLDSLATSLIRDGWSLKGLHRHMLLSHTYRQSSQRSAPAQHRDPGNTLLCGMNRQRLDAEALRDTLLLVSGQLDSGMAGAHPFPAQTEWKYTQHNPFKAVYETSHRSVYLMSQRTQRHPYFSIFDGADPSISTPARGTSTTPLQALFLLNSPFVHQQAATFADRLLHETPDDRARVQRLLTLCLSRAADRIEEQVALQFLGQVRQELRSEGLASEKLEQQSWQALIRAVFRLNEFVYLD